MCHLTCSVLPFNRTRTPMVMMTVPQAAAAHPSSMPPSSGPLTAPHTVSPLPSASPPPSLNLNLMHPSPRHGMVEAGTLIELNMNLADFERKEDADTYRHERIRRLNLERMLQRHSKQNPDADQRHEGEKEGTVAEDSIISCSSSSVISFTAPAGIPVSVPDLSSLIIRLMPLTTLATLQLDSIGLHSHHVNGLITLLEQHPTLTHISLAHNQLGVHS